MINTDKNRIENAVTKNVGGGQLIYWRGRTIYCGGYIPTDTDIDYFLLTSPRYPKIQEVRNNQKTVFMTSGEAKKKTTKRWYAIFKASNTSFYDLQEQGALLLP